MDTRRSILAPLALTSALGCNAQPAYYAGFAPLEIRDADLADEEAAHPVIGAWTQAEYWLDYRAPAPDELADLQPEGADPAQMVPWIRREDLDISVQYRLVNESDAPLRAWVLLDGATEFFDWNPVASYGMAGGEDANEIAFPSLLGFFPMDLDPGEVRTGEFREDDLSEAMLDLDVMTRFCGGPLALIYNRHEVDPIGMDQVPPDATFAGLGMIRLTLGANAPATLTYTIRVRDEAEVLFDARRDTMRYEYTPELYTPPGLAPGMEPPPDPGAYCQPPMEPAP